MSTHHLRSPRARRDRSCLLAVMALSLTVAGCRASDGDTDASMSTSSPAGGLTVALSGAAGDDRAGQLPIGEPFDLTVTVTNQGSRSVSAQIELALVPPDGGELAFHRETLFVPFGESASESVSITTSRWTGATGTFEVEASITDPAIDAGTAGLVFEVSPATRVVPVFDDVTEQVGLLTDVPEPVCGQFANGAAWDDIDGDGLPDLAVTRLGEPVQLFVNQPDGTFVEESAARGVAVPGANGAAFADYDNDGDADLMLVGDGADVLLRNDGSGHFVDVSATAGVAGDPRLRGMSAAWGDYDGDGLLDLYVTNYMECTGPWTTEAEIIENVEYHPDVLYRNRGDGSFAEATGELPGSDRSAGFTAAWLDADSTSPTTSWASRLTTTVSGATPAPTPRVRPSPTSHSNLEPACT
jgi:hypothetical protein